MNRNEVNNDDKGFLLQLHMRAEQKAKEYEGVLHEIQRLEVRRERIKEYVEQLNKLLEAEGKEPVLMKAMPHLGSPVGKPGNRSRALPLRKMQWEGMTINQIIGSILNTSPTASFHPRVVSSLIYEIESDSDLHMVMPNVRSSMQRGAREGLWERTGRAMFKAKVVEQQGTFGNT